MRISTRCFSLLWLLAFSLPAWAYSGIFPGLKYPAGDMPSSVALGDVNRDGLLDVVTANTEGNDVSVLLAQPGGGWSAPEHYAAGRGPSALALGDLNNDSLLDAVTANSEGNSVSVLLALPAGGFANPEEYAVGSGPSSVALGDLNGDGLLDIVTANSGSYDDPSNDVSVLLALQQGGFAEQDKLEFGHRPQAVALEDLNGDGLLDIVAATVNVWGEGPGDVSLRLAEEGGGFGDPRKYPVGEEPSSVVVGDLNGDGLPDIATAHGWGISVLLALPTGDFGNGDSYPGGSSLALGDMDGDGLLDIVTAGTSVDGVALLLARPAGGFEERGEYRVGRGRCCCGSSVALGDLNGDGLLDIVTGNAGSDDISVLVARGEAEFRSQEWYEVGESPFSVALGDLNGDGLLDIATANGNERTISVLLALSSGGFDEQRSYATSEAADAIALGDVTGDGLVDMVATRSALSVFPGLPDGGFAPEERHIYNWTSPLALADMNEDGRLEVVAAYFGTHDIAIATFSPGGELSEPERYALAGMPCYMDLGDLNADGLLDVVATHCGFPEGTGSGISLLISRPGGGFAEAENLAVGDHPMGISLGDANNDGRLDILITNWETDDVSLLAALPEGGFAPEERFPVGENPVAVDLGDVDADGLLDMVVANSERNDVSVLLGLPSGGFSPEERYAVGLLPYSVTLADVNRDGLLDVVTGNLGHTQGLHDVSVLYNLGGERDFIRGDANADGSVNISDAVTILRHLFLGTSEIPCHDSADVNDNGRLATDGPTDAIYLLGFLFLGGARPGEPFESCGTDRTRDGLACRAYAPCLAEP